jgi:hypothetical protein
MALYTNGLPSVEGLSNLFDAALKPPNILN